MMMTNPDKSGGSAEARALAALREEGGAAPSLHDPDVMRRALEVYEAKNGIQAAFELAADLLFEEFSTLQWAPPVGTALCRWATPRPNAPALLIHAMVQYLGLYYPEIESALTEVQELLASHELERAQSRLATALDDLVP